MTAGDAHGSAPPPSPRDPIERRAAVALAAMVVLGLVVRAAWAWSQRHAPLGGDPYYYHYQADLVAKGKGFLDPLDFRLNGSTAPDADHPPLFVLYLALWSLVGAGTVAWHLVATTLLGTASVGVLAITGRRLGGDRVGIVAGFLAAVAPNLWLWDGVLAAESMAIFAVSLFLLAVVRYLASPTQLGLVAVAAGAALAGLARAELILLVLAVVPLLLRTEGLAASARWHWLGAAALVVVVLVGPWAVYNQARFDEPVVLSTGLGLVTVSSSCDTAWYGPLTGYWDFACSSAGVTAARGDLDRLDGAHLDPRLRHVALHYAADHPARLPAVVAARVGRVSGLYRPVQQAHLQETNEGAPLTLAGAIMSTWYLLAGLAIVGGGVLRRAGVPLVALTAPVSAVVVTTVLTYGIARFRAPAETVVVVLAAVGVDALVRRRAESSAPPATGSLLATFAAPVASVAGA